MGLASKEILLMDSLEKSLTWVQWFSGLGFSLFKIQAIVTAESGIDLRTQLVDDVNRHLDLLKLSLDVLGTLDDWKTMMILYYYFLDHLTVVGVADTLRITYQWTHELMKRGLMVAI